MGGCTTHYLDQPDLHWDPNYSIYEEQEHACSDLFGGLLTRFASAGKHTLIINQVIVTKTVDAADLYYDDNFGAVLESHTHITVAQVSQTPKDYYVSDIQNSATRYGTILSNKRKQIDGDTLARRWEIPSDMARGTLHDALPISQTASRAIWGTPDSLCQRRETDPNHRSGHSY